MSQSLYVRDASARAVELLKRSYDSAAAVICDPLLHFDEASYVRSWIEAVPEHAVERMRAKAEKLASERRERRREGWAAAARLGLDETDLGPEVELGKVAWWWFTLSERIRGVRALDGSEGVHVARPRPWL